jgi:PKD repeat protein
MRSSRVLTLAVVALLAACGDSNGPSNASPAAGFAYSCSDLACSFTDQSGDTDGTVASYAWNFGEPGSASNTATTKNANHTFAAAGTFNVKLTVTDNGGGTNAKTIPVTVTASVPGGPTASFTATCTSVDCAITNTSTAPGAVVTWAWDFGDGTQTSNLEDPGTVHYSVTSPTDFTIKLVVTSDGATSQATQQVRVVPAATLTCNGVDCTLPVPAGATVMVTLVSADCQTHGNTFVITQPAPPDTLFTDGCFATPGATFPLNNGDAYTSDTELAAEVLSGLPGATNPQLRVTGDFASGWTLSFDDGFIGAGEPDFNDLVIMVKATGP